MCGTACEASLFMSGAATAQTAGRILGTAPSPCTRNGLWKRSRSAGSSRTTTDAGFALGAGHVSSTSRPWRFPCRNPDRDARRRPVQPQAEAEIWTKRRETWLPPVDGATQHEHNRSGASADSYRRLGARVLGDAELGRGIWHGGSETATGGPTTFIPTSRPSDANTVRVGRARRQRREPIEERLHARRGEQDENACRRHHRRSGSNAAHPAGRTRTSPPTRGAALRRA